MPVILSYACVVIVWSTTPMAIKLSNDSLSASTSIMCRMMLALIVVSIVVSIWQGNAVLKKKNWKIYLAAGLGIFPNMSLVYIAADYIPTGMIALLFSFNPVVSGIFASLILKESFLNKRRIVAISLAIFGLAIIFREQIKLDENSIYGILLIVTATISFALSQVFIKHLQRDGNVLALEQTLGALCFSVPFLVATAIFFNGMNLTTQIINISTTSLLAVLYLAVVGTVIGFMAFFFVLSRMSFAIVSAIPLVTPVLALWLGSYFLDETLTRNILIGTAFILIGLLVYGDLFMFVKNRAKRLIRA